MAIIKDFKTQHGVTAKYHKLTNVDISIPNNSVTLKFAIYLDEETRRAGSVPLWNEYVTIPLDSFEENPVKFFYPLASALDISYLKDGISDVQDVVSPVKAINKEVAEVAQVSTVAGPLVTISKKV